ncbi:MAG: winged helix-turn-helix domain-containing protein [Candidatus Sulfotelmatobacter sp.]
MSESQYRFAEFQLDCASFELRRQGRAQKSEHISLERIPMELLILLLERQGSVVTRQEIVDRLWGKDVFVDTEHGINTAIHKIRQALRDDPEQPRFILTVSGKGYRFVAERSSTNGSSSIAAPPTEAMVPPLPTATPATELAPAPKHRFRLAAVTALILLVVAGILIAVNAGGMRARLFPSTRAAQIHSIAVLPLANLSGDSSQDYFADGMTDELITALAKNRSLRVVSRTSAMRYKAVQRPVREIARELGVDGILEGSVSRNANRVHMTVQLIYAPTDTHVWAESYDRDFNQAFSLPEELSQTVAKEVKTAILPAPGQRYINPEAHDAYLRGRDFWFDGDNTHSLVYFRKAIQLQPDYAAAWSGIADSYGKFAITSERPVQEVAAEFEAAARKAVALDDSSSEAHCSFAAWYFFLAWDLPHADAESRRATELDPNYSEAHHLRSYVLAAMNRPEQSLQEAKRAIELDPFRTPWGLGYAYIQTRQIDAAINELRMRDQAYPDDVGTIFYLSEAYWLKGIGKESAEKLEKGLELMDDPEKADEIHRAFQRGGQKAVAQWRVESDKTRVRREYISSYFHARSYAYLGDRNAVLKFLDLAYHERSPLLILIQNEPIFDFVHSDPRYHALVGKLGLTPSY